MTLEAEPSKGSGVGFTGWLSNLLFGQYPRSDDDGSDEIDEEDSDVEHHSGMDECRGRTRDRSPPSNSPQRRSQSPESFMAAPIAAGGDRKRRLIKLTSSGNLVVECPIPKRLREAVRQAKGEFGTMRYTAVCCEPDEFVANGYTLRQQIVGRKTDLFVVMTLYNVTEKKGGKRVL